METLRLYGEEPYSDILSPPGLYRYIIWTQGCLKLCPGCMSVSSRPLDGGYVKEISALARDILAVNGIEGVTISGGEPFLQAQSLTRLIKLIRESKDFGITVYTGNTYETLIQQANENIDIKEFLDQIDVLIDGEYQEALNDNGALRGSSNQRVIRLTNRYPQKLIDTSYGVVAKRRSQIKIESRTISIAGVPDSAQYAAFEHLYNNQNKNNNNGGLG